MTLAELQERLGEEGLLVVDVRTAGEFEGSVGAHCDPRHGHIPGAVNVPLERFFDCRDVEQVRAAVGVAPGSEIVAYCHSGSRSAFAVQVLREAGYDARNYVGSWHEWSRAVPTGTAL